MSNGATAKCMCLKCRSCFRYSEIAIFVSKNYFFVDSVFLTGELIDVERGYSEMHVFHVGCVFTNSETHFLFFVPNSLKGELSDVEWGYSEVASLTSIRYLVIVEPVLLTGDLS